MAQVLNDIDRRVLGVLLEKSLGQPSYYPMTLNATLAACNQKQNRDPVMELDDCMVAEALGGLQDRGLVSLVLPTPGGRANRYRHEAEPRLGWQKGEQAVMAELLLRGPQTVGELRSRCSRLVPFEDTGAVSTVLDGLAQRDPPVVTAMPRSPGQSAIRYRHLLYPDGRQPGVAMPPVITSEVPSEQAPEEIGTLRVQMENLQAEIGELHDSLADLHRRLSDLEKLL